MDYWVKRVGIVARTSCLKRRFKVATKCRHSRILGSESSHVDCHFYRVNPGNTISADRIAVAISRERLAPYD
jgi:hypothetical protein